MHVKSFKIAYIALIVSVIATGVPGSSAAAPLSQADYLSFDASVRNRAAGEKRFSKILQVVYGNPDLVKKYFGERGLAPRQRISLKSAKGSITLRSTVEQNVVSVDFAPRARVGEDMLVLVVNNARCRIGQQDPELCQAEIRVVKGKTSISNRILASGSNGAEYDSGSMDVTTGNLIIDGDGSR